MNKLERCFKLCYELRNFNTEQFSALVDSPLRISVVMYRTTESISVRVTRPYSIPSNAVEFMLDLAQELDAEMEVLATGEIRVTF